MRTVSAATARRARLAAVVFALVVFAGCRTAPPPKPVAALPWPERRAQLQALDTFEIKGRVAVAAGSEGFSARLTWDQAGPRSSVALDGPLGVGGLRVVADGNDLNVTTSRGVHLASDEARAELSAKLGFEPPLGSLRYWVLGVPDPAAQPAIETIGPDQRLLTLEQSGWHIEYLAYAQHDGDSLPQRMALQRSDVRLRLIVEDWKP
jgi:outer membrane lipoprotein LolB